MTRSTKKTTLRAVLGVLAITAVVAAIVQPSGAQQAAPGKTDDQSWQAVAPGLVEPASGQIKIMASVVAPVRDVLVSTNDKVLAGQLLVGLDDQEARARAQTAQAQVAMATRARNDQAAGKAADRRKAEDAVAEAAQAVVKARDAFDDAAIARHLGNGSEADLANASAALTSAQQTLKQRREQLRKVESDSGTPLPTQNEGQLNVNRSNLWLAEVELEKLRIRAPVAGTVLQVRARAGEMAAPSASEPLVIVGDLSALRVRAELDERDIGDVKIGQQVVIRADAFPGRDFVGKVSSIAPLVQPGSISSPGSRNLTDFDVTEVRIDLADPGPLMVGMKVDAYFRRSGGASQ